MKATERQRHECAAWTGIARSLREASPLDVGRKVEEDFWLSEVVKRMGPVAGLKILDCGCGEGYLSAYLADRGASVYGFDLAPEMLQNARRVVSDDGTNNQPHWTAAAMESLPFRDNSFDRVMGGYILHHVEIATAMSELHRVLKPGGVGVFVETWGKNLLLLWARRHLAGRWGIARFGTLSECPLTEDDLFAMQQVFWRVQALFPRFVCFMKAASNLFQWKGPFLPLARLMVACDRFVDHYFPSVRPWSYYCLIELRKSDQVS